MIYLTDGSPFPQTIVDVRNDGELARDVNYASITAPEVVKCELLIDDVVIEVVYAGMGSSHSWWTPAGGKFFPPYAAPSGLRPGSRLVVRVDKECALRIDWIE